MKFSTFITFVLSLLFTQAVFADKVEPPKDAVAFRGNHYKAFLDTNSTWWEAKFACDDIGGELVVITTAQENEFVRRMAKGNLIWLGGTDEFEEGKCVLRAKIDMSSSFMCMRDPALYRIRFAFHHQTKDVICTRQDCLVVKQYWFLLVLY